MDSLSGDKNSVNLREDEWEEGERAEDERRLINLPNGNYPDYLSIEMSNDNFSDYNHIGSNISARRCCLNNTLKWGGGIVNTLFFGVGAFVPFFIQSYVALRTSGLDFFDQSKTHDILNYFISTACGAVNGILSFLFMRDLFPLQGANGQINCSKIIKSWFYVILVACFVTHYASYPLVGGTIDAFNKLKSNITGVLIESENLEAGNTVYLAPQLSFDSAFERFILNWILLSQGALWSYSAINFAKLVFHGSRALFHHNAIKQNSKRVYSIIYLLRLWSSSDIEKKDTDFLIKNLNNIEGKNKSELRKDINQLYNKMIKNVLYNLTSEEENRSTALFTRHCGYFFFTICRYSFAIAAAVYLGANLSSQISNTIKNYDLLPMEDYFYTRLLYRLARSNNGSMFISILSSVTLLTRLIASGMIGFFSDLDVRQWRCEKKKLFWGVVKATLPTASIIVVPFQVGGGQVNFLDPQAILLMTIAFFANYGIVRNISFLNEDHVKIFKEILQFLENCYKNSQIHSDCSPMQQPSHSTFVETRPNFSRAGQLTNNLLLNNLPNTSRDLFYPMETQSAR